MGAWWWMIKLLKAEGIPYRGIPEDEEFPGCMMRNIMMRIIRMKEKRNKWGRFFISSGFGPRR
jgi:hypothetical protein